MINIFLPEGADELFGNAGPLKNNSAVSRLFYFPEVQPGKPVDEPHRFFSKHMLEKQMDARKKQNDHEETAANKNNSKTSVGDGLLKKKFLNRPASSRSNGSAQHQMICDGDFSTTNRFF